MPTMSIRYLTICYLLYSVNAKLVSKTIEEKNEVAETVRNIKSSEEERGNNREYSTETIRNPRRANESAANPNVTQLKRTTKPKVALVRKPIPKFTYTESEEDYLTQRLPNKISDTIDHEDEDFSFDDYDFDVNHDEFAGRGKPLEPRVKVKVRQRRPTPAKVEQPRPAPALSQSKVEVLHGEGKPFIKVVRKAAPGVMKEEEYDEEFSAITKSSDNQRKTIAVRDTASFSEETEDSEEEEMRRPMRTTRTIPFSFDTYVDKLGDKTSEFATKMLSFLPLFPRRYPAPEKVNDNVTAENAAMVEPWPGSTTSD